MTSEVSCIISYKRGNGGDCGCLCSAIFIRSTVGSPENNLGDEFGSSWGWVLPSGKAGSQFLDQKGYWLYR